jgi:hypothetical protein
MTISLSVKDPGDSRGNQPGKSRPKAGIVDGERVILACSNCRTPLAELFITRPHALRANGQPFRWKAKARCWKCGDESWPVDIEGMYHLGHPAHANPDDPDNERLITVVVDVTEENDVLIFHTKQQTG